MNQTSYEKGMEKGVEEGIEKGRRELIQEQLEEQFGLLTEAVQQRLSQLSLDRLRALGRALLRAQPLRELGLEDAE